MSSGVQTGAEAYRPPAPFRDELFEPGGTPRPAAVPLVRELARLGPEWLVEAGRRRDAPLMQQGIAFYADVASVKGPYLGGATSALTAAVTMSRLDPQAARACEATRATPFISETSEGIVRKQRQGRAACAAGTRRDDGGGERPEAEAEEISSAARA